MVEAISLASAAAAAGASASGGAATGFDPIVLFAIIGVLGIGSQWLAWRLRIPAIVLMLGVGLLAGPVTGAIDPEPAFGELFRPIISVAVAVILFEGGLTLNAKGLQDAEKAVRRLVVIGAPLGWLLSTLAARYGAGLSWEAALVFGGILVVTGPTVVTPLLRQAKLAPRPASVLRWEAIVNDAVGALLAVLAFEVVTALRGAGTLAEAAEHLAIGISVALVAGFAAGWGIAAVFRRGAVPEYMKVPVLFAAVLGVYASTDSLLHESGLLAVTVMGLYLANAGLPSLEELKRFKEHATVILVSGVFILLAASLDPAILEQLSWRSVLFVLLVVLVARPLTVMLALQGSGLPVKERAIIAWIGPRGIVAVAVSGLFGTRLAELGVADGALLGPLAFALVAVTVVVHGFSLAPLARHLGLTSREPPGVLLVGGSPWAAGLAGELQKAGVPVLVADRNWYRLRPVRAAGVSVFAGEILSEAAEHSVDLNRYATLIAATENDAYNTLVCTDYAPEFGRTAVFQIGRHEPAETERDLPASLGGRTLGSGLASDELFRRIAAGWQFKTTRLGDGFDFERYRAEHPEAEPIALIRAAGQPAFFGTTALRPGAGDRVVAMVPREAQRARAAG